ncbi:hypothetical protein CDL15_Pgr008143 [Punica granatum]|uniref:Amidase domain-containing protein n=1 Tax=Punica granatum TaxID=22663 RepID=A0A218VU60_PUNGR|nr:hypothetical protein CDL15_Pgr008143 [Punica granatum]
MSKPVQAVKASMSNPKAWVVIGLTVAGIVILAETHRRRRKGKRRANAIREDFGAFVEKFELLPFPQPPPPALKQPLAGLSFAIKDIFDVKGYVAGFGSSGWAETHEAAGKTAVVVTALLKNGAKCVGKTVMDELAFGMTGENTEYGTPVNPKMPSHIPGGSSSGSAVAVAAELVDFALGTDTTGCVRIPASFCGILGYRPSHGAVSTVGVLPNSPSLDTVDQPPKHINFGQHIASSVPSLKGFREQSTNHQNGISALKALSSAMLSLQRCEFKTNYEDWVDSVKLRFRPHTTACVQTAISTSTENIKTLYKIRSEMRAALHDLLKEDGILVIPTIADPPLALNMKKRSFAEFYDRALTLLSISSLSGCCQATIPLGNHDDFPISISFIAFHGADKFLLDTVSDMYSSLQEQASIVSSSLPLPDTNGDMDASELLKEKGNAAYKGRQWNKAVNYYSEAIKLNETNATYYCNRAAAYLELGCFRQAEEDCSRAISLDKKNVKAYLRRGAARESLLCYKEALQDFKHALVLEPQNKYASTAEKRLRKLLS